VHVTDGNGEVHKTAITEIKNLNSFSVLERATNYEIHRQIEQWKETGSLGRKSTMGGTKGPRRHIGSAIKRTRRIPLIPIRTCSGGGR